MKHPIMLHTKTLPAISENLDAYISAISDIRVLTLEEEQYLATRLIEDNDLKAAQALVLSHLKFVVHIARSFNGYGLSMIDLVQEGNVGLMKAVRRFDPTRGVRLISFAVHWIKSEIHDYIIKNWRIVKIATTKSQRKLFFNLRSMKSHLGWLTSKETEAIAKDLGVTVEDVSKMEARLSSSDVAFDLSADTQEEANYSPSDWLADASADPLAMLEAEDYEQKNTVALSNAFTTLDVRSRDILMRRWMNDDENKPTLHDLAAEYNVSAERIRQIEVQAMKKIKAVLIA